MANAANLAIALSMTGQSAVENGLKSVAHSVGAVGHAALAPIKALGGFGGALVDIGKTAVGVAVGGGLAMLPGLMLDYARGAADDEAATLRLQQTIRNLGGDYDALVAQVDDAIAAGQKLAFSDDDVRDSYQFLATATGDATEALARQRLAMDVARGANIPLSQATKMLGKLNEENIETFRKLGIVIGDNATESEALAAIQAKFSGQADAFANSTAGQFEQAKIAIAEIQESIGSALLPVLTAVGRALADNLPAIQEFIGSFAGGISEQLIPLIERLQPIFASAFDSIQPVIQPLLDILPDLGTAISQVIGFMASGSGDIEVFRGVLTRLLGPDGAQGVIEVFTNLVGFFRQDVLPLWDGLAKAAQKALGGDFAGAIKQAATAIGAFAAKLVESLSEWGRRFVEWVAPLIPPLLAELGRLLLEIGGWLLTVALPAIAMKLLEWTKAFVQWVGPLIPPLLIELGKLLLALGNWTVEIAAPEIVKALVAWSLAFLNWVGTSVVPYMAEKLNELRDEVIEWIKGRASTFSNEATKLGAALITGIVSGIQGAKDRIFSLLLEIGREALRRAISAVTGGAASAGASSGAAASGGGSATTQGTAGSRERAGLTINQTIDARGGDYAAVTSATVDALARSRLTSGAI